MSGTLNELYDAVFSAVGALGPTGTKSFSVVTDFGGELTPETISQVTQDRFPAALVAVASEDPFAPASVDTTTREMQSVATISFVVYVVVESVRGYRDAEKGVTGGAKGLFALVSELCAALNGLTVAGLWGTGRVHYAGLRPALFKPGNTGVLCVYAARFQAARIVEQVELTTETDGPTVQFQQFDGSVNAVPAGAYDAAATPLAYARDPNLHD